MTVYVVEAPEGADSVWTTRIAASERVKYCAECEIQNALEEESDINDIWAYGEAGEYIPPKGEYKFPDMPLDDLFGAGVEVNCQSYAWHVTELTIDEEDE